VVGVDDLEGLVQAQGRVHQIPERAAGLENGTQARVLGQPGPLGDAGGRGADSGTEAIRQDRHFGH
jgi:hypothetical protein